MSTENSCYLLIANYCDLIKIWACNTVWKIRNVYKNKCTNKRERDILPFFPEALWQVVTLKLCCDNTADFFKNDLDIEGNQELLGATSAFFQAIFSAV